MEELIILRELVEQHEDRIAYLQECVRQYEQEISALNSEVKRLQVEQYNGRSSN